MKQLSIGDKNLTTKFINAYFGINGETFTKTTAERVKQFQQSFQQIYENDPNIAEFTEEYLNKYTQLYRDSNGELQTKINEVLPVLWPNGIVDILTLNAILGTEIDYYDYTKIQQCKQALNGTQYSAFGNIFEMLCEMAKNLNFRLDDNLDFIPTLVDKTIKRIIGADTKSFGGADQVFERDDLVDYHLCEFTIYGKSIYEGDDYKLKEGRHINIGDINESEPYLTWLDLTVPPHPIESPSVNHSIYINPPATLPVYKTGLNNLGHIKLQKIVNTLGSGNTYILEDDLANINISNGQAITPPATGTYIESAERQVFSTVPDTGLTFHRYITLLSEDSSLTEYFIWMDKYYVIHSIETKIHNNEYGKLNIDVIAPPSDSCNKLLYLIGTTTNAVAKIENLGVYDNFENVTLNDEYIKNVKLYNIFDTYDTYNVVTGRLIKRIGTLTLDENNINSNFSHVNYKGKNAIRINIVNENIDVRYIYCSHFDVDDSKPEYIKAEENYLYIVDDAFSSLDLFKQFVASEYNKGTPIILYYRHLYDIYYHLRESPNLINCTNCRYLMTSNIDMEIHYKMDPRFKLDTDILTNANPFYPGVIKGVGDTVGNTTTLQIYSENKDASETQVTTIPLSTPLHGFDSNNGDYYDVTQGTIYRKCHQYKLTGDEIAIDVSPYSNSTFTVFGIPNILKDRSLTEPGLCNCLIAQDNVWLGQGRGFSFDTSAPQNLYISIDNEILETSENCSNPQKIQSFRNWLRKCNLENHNPVTIYYISRQPKITTDLPKYEIAQYRNYTRIYNSYNANMEIRLHVAIALKKGEVMVCGLYEEGIIDLSETLPDTFLSYDNGLYDKHIIEAIRLYQKMHDIGQDTEYGRYYSGVLNVPTYNAIKKEFGLTEEVDI